MAGQHRSAGGRRWDSSRCHAFGDRAGRRSLVATSLAACRVAQQRQPDTGQRKWVGAIRPGSGRAAPLAVITRPTHVVWPARPRVDVVNEVLRTAQVISTAEPSDSSVVHRSMMPRADLSRGFPPRTMPARSVIDAAEWATSDDRARAIITAAFQQRLVDHAAMMLALSRFARLGRRELITSTIHDAAGGSESIAEHDFLILCRRGRLPEPTRQVVTTDAAGRRRYRRRISRNSPFTSRSTAGSTPRSGSGGPTCNGRTRWASTATGCSDSRRGPSATDPERVLEQVRAALIAGGWRP